MRSGLREVGVDLGERRHLAAGQREGQGGEDLLLEAAVADPRRADALPLAVAEDGERKLRGEQLVIGEAREVRARAARGRCGFAG